MDLTNVFGVNVRDMFMKWFDGEFTENFAERFPDKEGLTLVILDPQRGLELYDLWENPLSSTLLQAYIGDEEASLEAGGTRENVERKLRFVLRTLGQGSVMAEHELAYMVLPGDFPVEGAGEHMGFYGGVSGLKKQDDWTVFTECVDKLVELLQLVNEAAAARAKELSSRDDAPVDAKYLIGIDVSDLFPKEKDAGDEETAETSVEDAATTA
jgi:hypothetical protein